MNRLHRLLCPLLVLFALLSFSIPACAAIYYVSPSGSDSSNGLSPDVHSGSTGPFFTLQHALSLVSNGDTVELRAGTYPESVYAKNIGSSSNPVTIMNYNGEQVTFTRGTSPHSLYFDTCAFVLQGLNFTSGGVVLLNALNSTVTNSTFTEITDNIPLYIQNASSLTVESNTFKNNGYSSTIDIAGQSNCTVTNNVFQDNVDINAQESSNVFLVSQASGSITISANSIFDTVPASQLAVKSPGTTTSAMMIFESPGVTIEGNTIKDFRFQGTNDCTSDNPSYLKTPAAGGENGVGINVVGSTPVVKESVTISNNTVTDCSQEGIVCSYVKNSEISGNTVTNCGEYGIFIIGITGDSVNVVNNTIEENITSGNGWLYGGTSGISVIHVGTGNIIRRNFSFGNKNGTAGEVGQNWYADGNGIIADVESNGTIIENNLSVSNEGAGIAVTSASNVVILNNTVVGNGYCPQNVGSYGIIINGGSGPADNATIVNNLIYNNYYTQLMVWKTQLNHVIHNNLYSIGPFTDPGYQNYVIDWGGKGYTLAQWQSLMSGTSNGVGSVEAVPQFAGDISQMIPDNFKLSGPPGTGDGAPLSEFTNLIGYLITWDYDGATRNATAPTIGAFEASTGLWSNATTLGNGWKWLKWFGYFTTSSSPWIYHMQHGWLYPYGTSTDSIWFYDSAMGAFWWTSAADYPYVYRTSDGTWLFYDMGTSNPRWFYNYKNKGWEKD